MRAKLTRLDHPFRIDRRTSLELPAGSLLSDAIGPGAWDVYVNGGRLEPGDESRVRAADGDLITARPVVGVEGFFAGVAAFFKAYGAYIAIANTVISLAYSAYSGYLSYRASRAGRDKSGAISGQPFYSVNGTSNQLRPFGSVPQHYGTLTAVPDLLMPPISTVSDAAVQTVQCLFCVGKGFYTPVTVDALRYGEQPVTSLGVQHFAGYDGLTNAGQPSAVLARYLVNVIEEPLGLELRHVANTGSVTQVRTTQASSRSFDVQFVFPQGLIRIASDGKQRPTSVTLRVRYRAVGDTEWTLTLERFIVGFIPSKFAINHHVEPATVGQFEVESKLIATEPASVYSSDRGGAGGSAVQTGDAVWTSLRSYLFGQSVIDSESEGLTMFGLAIEASELVNGQMDRITVECTRSLPTWSEADGWSDVDLGYRNPAAYTPTQNPAWAYANELRDSGIPDDEIDAPQIKRWADFCDDQGWECNLPYNDEQILDDSLVTIASCGQAFPTMRGSMFSVVFDELREPVAAFGPRNMTDLVVSQTPLERVDALQVRFSNADASGRLDERVVYLNGQTAETAEVFRTIDVLNGLTDPALVERYVRLEDLKQRLRTIGYTWKSDWSAIVCEVGDVVVLQHHGALLGDDTTTVDSYTTKSAGAYIDEVFIYPAVRLETGRTYGLRVRTRDEGANGGFRILTLPIVNPLTAGAQRMSALTVSGNVAVPTYTDAAEVVHADTLEGQPAFFGSPTDGLVMVTEVKTARDGSCSLQAIELAPELFDEELITTTFAPTVSTAALPLAPPGQPVLAQPVYSRVQGTGNTGAITVGVFSYFNLEYVVQLAPPESFPTLSHYRVDYRYHLAGIATDWIALPDVAAPAGPITVGPASSVAPNVDIRIRPVTATGVQGPALLLENVAPTQTITVLGF